MSDVQKFFTLSEKVPVEATIECIKYIEEDKNRDSVKGFVESAMPFGEKASIKYRGIFLERFVEIEGETIVYSPLLKYINSTPNYQWKKDIIYFITCTKHECVGECVKAYVEGELHEELSSKELFDFFKAHMPDFKDSSIEKTNSTVMNILKDFNILVPKNDSVAKNKIYKFNTNIRPSNEVILFCLYYEFIKIKDIKMPKSEAIINADVFKYFLMTEQLVKKYLRWMQDNGYIENYVMGDNSQYQFKYDNLEQLIEKVIK